MTALRQGGNYNPCSAVAIIVSHGINGNYAYNRQGGQLAGVGGADEAENGIVGGAADSRFVMKDFVDSTANPFDDIVLPLTANDLLASLTNNGSVQSAQAILQSDFTGITASITAAAFTGRTGAAGAGSYPLTVPAALVATPVKRPLGERDYPSNCYHTNNQCNSSNSVAFTMNVAWARWCRRRRR